MAEQLTKLTWQLSWVRFFLVDSITSCVASITEQVFSHEILGESLCRNQGHERFKSSQTKPQNFSSPSLPFPIILYGPSPGEEGTQCVHDEPSGADLSVAECRGAERVGSKACSSEMQAWIQLVS